MQRTEGFTMVVASKRRSLGFVLGLAPLVLMTGLLVACEPPDPSGGTVTVNPGTVNYTATAGVNNKLFVYLRRGVLTFRDPVAGVTSTDPLCTVLSPYKVSCNGEMGPDGIQMNINLGDGNDTGTMQDEFGFLFTSMTGGPGSDVLNGGPGADSFLDGDDLEADTYNGGENFDTISYTDSIGVNVSLNDVADDGRAGEGDNAVDIEYIRGTSGADTLTGNDEENFIEGFGGNDTINGLGGNDILNGGADFDVIDGGEGSDSCNLGPGSNETEGTAVNCP